MKDTQNTPAVLGPVERVVRPARAWLVRCKDWPADRVEAVAGEVQPAWASIARPLYFVDDIDECVAAERERCAKVCEDSNTYDEYDPGGHFAELIRGSGPNVGNNRL